MSHIFTLISGIFVGIYLDQKYKLPEITKYINNILVFDNKINNNDSDDD